MRWALTMRGAAGSAVLARRAAACADGRRRNRPRRPTPSDSADAATPTPTPTPTPRRRRPTPAPTPEPTTTPKPTSPPPRPPRRCARTPHAEPTPPWTTDPQCPGRRRARPTTAAADGRLPRVADRRGRPHLRSPRRVQLPGRGGHARDGPAGREVQRAAGVARGGPRDRERGDQEANRARADLVALDGRLEAARAVVREWVFSVYSGGGGGSDVAFMIEAMAAEPEDVGDPLGDLSYLTEQRTRALRTCASSPPSRCGSAPPPTPLRRRPRRGHAQDRGRQLGARQGRLGPARPGRRAPRAPDRRGREGRPRGERPRRRSHPGGEARPPSACVTPCVPPPSTSPTIGKPCTNNTTPSTPTA